MNGFDADSEAVVKRVGERLFDLSTPTEGLAEPVTLETLAGLEVLRHSCAHVLAQAVQQLYPEAKLGIGPFIEDGFYYDFLVDEPFSPEDLRAIEQRMRSIIKAGQHFVRREISAQQARQELADEPFKQELIDSALEADGSLSIYDNVDSKTGETAWRDLCRGPHLPSTKRIGGAFALTHVSSAYWRGDEKRPQLQRIYGTAWATREDLQAYQQRLEQARKRDHRRVGKELDLFSFPDEIGSGLAVFHPKGGIIRSEMENYARQRHIAGGYNFVYTPHITKKNLFEQSGHLQWYREGMFPAMTLDGDEKSPGTDYYLKPMNCPFHNLIFNSRPRSYRELPLRLVEFGTVYRYEKSGTIHGLTRVRGLTQDDAHIYTTEEYLQSELEGVLNFVTSLLRDYGLEEFYIELSTRDDSDKFLGSAHLWERATEVLRKVAVDSGLELRDDPGGAAFYGPKISVQARDAIGRYWQMSTIQLDFNLPERFDLFYTNAQGERQRPIMIHRALFGSIERFFGVLTEHYAGAFPVWLSPEQAIGVPVAEEHAGYLQQLTDELTENGVRARVDNGADRMPKKIRTHTKEKVPFILVAGDRDREHQTVSLRFRDGSQLADLPRDKAIAGILASIRQKKQINRAEDF